MARTASVVALVLMGLGGCNAGPSREQLVGNWAILDHAPVREAKDNCATDNAIDLEADGTFGGLYDSGKWSLEDKLVTIQITESSEASGGELSPVRLNPVRLLRWEILRIDGFTVTVKSEGLTFWLYNCKPNKRSSG